jgi:hypothetical protein
METPLFAQKEGGFFVPFRLEGFGSFPGKGKMAKNPSG